MTDPIEQVAERPFGIEIATHSEYPFERNCSRYALFLEAEVLALRKLCRALAEDLSALVPGHLESDVAALAAYRQHFPEPKPDVTKEPR